MRMVPALLCFQIDLKGCTTGLGSSVVGMGGLHIFYFSYTWHRMLAGSAVNHQEITLLIMEFGSCL